MLRFALARRPPLGTADFVDRLLLLDLLCSHSKPQTPARAENLQQNKQNELTTTRSIHSLSASSHCDAVLGVALTSYFCHCITGPLAGLPRRHLAPIPEILTKVARFDFASLYSFSTSRFSTNCCIVLLHDVTAPVSILTKAAFLSHPGSARTPTPSHAYRHTDLTRKGIRRTH